MAVGLFMKKSTLNFDKGDFIVSYPDGYQVAEGEAKQVALGRFVFIDLPGENHEVLNSAYMESKTHYVGDVKYVDKKRVWSLNGASIDAGTLGGKAFVNEIGKKL